MFFLELARETGDESYLRAARGGADELLASLESERDTGLYDGLAGIGYTLGEVYRQTRDEKYRKGATQAVALLRERAQRVGRGVQWSEVTDIISGTSGTGLFLLWAARELGLSDAKAVAADAGRRLIEIGQVQDGGGLKWMMHPDESRELPNFSHGTAGVAFFLATLYQDTLDQHFLGCALSAFDCDNR